MEIVKSLTDIELYSKLADMEFTDLQKSYIRELCGRLVLANQKIQFLISNNNSRKDK